VVTVLCAPGIDDPDGSVVSLIGNANWQTVLQVRICEQQRVVQGMAGCPVEGLVYLLIEADTRILESFIFRRLRISTLASCDQIKTRGTYVALPSNRDDTGLLAGSR
jgi:hypothetical protein